MSEFEARLQRLELTVEHVSRSASRWRGIALAAIGALVLLPFAADAVELDTNDIAEGEPISAELMRQRFEALAAAVTDVERVAGTFCGVGAVDDGDRGGYAVAPATCPGECDALTVHVCTGPELVRSEIEGVEIPEDVWYATGSHGVTVGGENIRDCEGFQNASAANHGAMWSTGNHPSFQACDQQRGLACCD